MDVMSKWEGIEEGIAEVTLAERIKENALCSKIIALVTIIWKSVMTASYFQASRPS